jgi:hypothetical protein
VPSSAAAAFTEPSRSARAKARSASARSTKKRLGCQPSPAGSARPPERAEPARSCGGTAAGGRPSDWTVALTAYRVLRKAGPLARQRARYAPWRKGLRAGLVGPWPRLGGWSVERREPAP